MGREWTVVDISHICPHQYLKKGPKGQEKNSNPKIFFDVLYGHTPLREGGAKLFLKKRLKKLKLTPINLDRGK